MLYPVKTVYLAGPITDLSYGEARHGWREEFASLLPEHILPMSPMRGKDFLDKEVKLVGHPSMYPEHLMATPSGIVCRDRNDVRNCDAMIACFTGYPKASIGTSIEFGWADAFGKPVIMVMEDDNIHQHAMLTEIAGYVTSDLEEAANILFHLLTPGV